MTYTSRWARASRTSRWTLALALLPSLARAAPGWDAYQIIMWQGRTQAQLDGLPALGFTAAHVQATGGTVDRAGRDAVLAAGLGYYLENVATDFYAPYHRYTDGKTVTWAFDAAKARLRTGDLTAFHREPSLLDPVWLDRIRARLREIAAQEPGALFVNLADESGIADLAAAWDADTAPASLAAMRVWLREAYGTLDALNRQWGTGFVTWDDVVPELTEAALRRQDDNYSAWSDFKAWMDVAFSRAVQAGAIAVHEGRPGMRAALEGGQVPGWGGYDYALLAPTLDVMEIYDFGEALDMALAFNPALLPMRTSFGGGAAEVHTAWRSVLHGGRGMVIWDEANDVVAADGTPGPRGQEIAAFARTLAPVFPILRDTVPDPDPVAVLVDQESFRLTWLLDRRAGDHDWAARDAEREYDDNAWRASRRVLIQGLAEAGVQPQLVSTPMLESGRMPPGTKLLILPHAIALSDAAVAAVHAFQAAGGTVLADTEPGLFDGHGRRRPAPPLPDVAHPQPLRLVGDPPDPQMIAELLRSVGVVPRVRLLAPDGTVARGVEARWFKGPRGTVLALQAGRPWGSPPSVTVEFATPLRAMPVLTRNLRQPGPVSPATRYEFQFDGIEPTVLLLTPP